jgi:hypothetical protein
MVITTPTPPPRVVKTYIDALKNTPAKKESNDQVPSKKESNELPTTTRNNCNCCGDKIRINGKNAEKMFVNLMNCKIFSDEFMQFFRLPEERERASLVPGYTKSDVQMSNLRFQVKSTRVHKTPQKNFYEGRGGQVDKRTCNSLIKLLSLERFGNILWNFFEVPINSFTGKVDYSIGSKRLTTQNYSQKVLDGLISEFESKKKEFLEIAFLGNNQTISPDFISFIRYEKFLNCEKDLIVYRVRDVIDYLARFNFTIGRHGTCLTLGGIFSVRRKGGDSGRPGANKVQSVLNVEVLLDHLKGSGKGFYYQF